MPLEHQRTLHDSGVKTVLLEKFKTMLLAGKSSIQTTYYDILSVKEDANYEEIRTSYRSAVLNSHPDKSHRISTTSNPPLKSQEKFLNVQKAWEILGNSKTRAVYDRELQAARLETETAEDISLEEMTIEDVGEALELFYQCRCGDYFSIDSVELEEMGYSLDSDAKKLRLKNPDSSLASVIIPCGSCSLKIRLMIERIVSLICCIFSFKTILSSSC